MYYRNFSFNIVWEAFLQKKMELFIHTFDNKIHSCTFSHTDKVLAVQKKFNPHLESLILYRNSILIPNMTLNDYKITSGDHIYIIPRNSSSRYKADNPSNYSVKVEVEKIKDMMYAKIDSTPQYFNKIVKRFKRIAEKDEFNDDLTTFVIPSKPSIPSISPLPSFWK